MKDQEKTTKQKNRGISRRDFMGSAAAAAAAFTIVPRHVLGGAGYTPPSEKLNIASIGAAGQAVVDINNLCKTENIVALCDVDWGRAAGTFKRFPRAKQYSDFRKMLEKEDKNIDTVIVAIPDHSHAVAAIAAIKMGKHVYCEKPLTHDIFEARKLAEAAREAKVVTQMGNQGQASESVRLLCEWIWDGAIGPVREVHNWSWCPVWPQGMGRPEETPPVPSKLDWDLWLGTAPERPYHPCYAPKQWRGWWDFGTGAMGDQGCHTLFATFKALKLKHPVSVEACNSYRVNKMWDKSANKETYPKASIIRYKFPARGDMPPVELTWYDGGLKPPRPEELADDDRRLGNNQGILEERKSQGGILHIGDKGKMLNGRLIPQARMKEYKRPPKTLPRSIGHYEEFIEACKGGKPAGSNFDVAGPLTEAVLLGNLALRVGKTLHWDGPNMKVTNVPEANEYVQRKYRQGWTL